MRTSSKSALGLKTALLATEMLSFSVLNTECISRVEHYLSYIPLAAKAHGLRGLALSIVLATVAPTSQPSSPSVPRQTLESDKA